MNRSKWLSRSEWAICLGATLVALWLHISFFRYAGALWRDEIGGFGIATLPTFQELWAKLTLDSSPLYSPLALRGWSALGFGQSDLGLRRYGLLVGLALLGALWLNARLLGRRLPLISLGLLAANLTLVRWGDSVRAYGAGCVFMLLTLGLVWWLAERPTKWRFLLATLAAVLSVQTLYQNAFLLLAAGLSASLVCLRRRQWKAIVLILSVGLVAALSLLPYVPGVRASSQNWWIIQKTGFVPGWVWQNITSATGSPYDWQAPVWIGLGLLAAGLGLVRGWRKSGPDADLALFGAGTMILATGLFLLFIWTSGLPTQVWYFLPLLTFVAACANAVLGSSSGWLRPAGVGFAALMILLSGPKANELVRTRQTDLDIIAAHLSAKADPQDFIVIHPWYCGVTFNRYYHGAARWSTAPPMPDYRVPCFDVLKEQMLADNNPMVPVLTSCTNALASGHRVWLIGWFDFNGQEPPQLPKPPNGPQGWNEVPYEDAWAAQVSYLTVNRAAELASVPLELPQPVSPYENLALWYAKGWRTNAALSASSPP